MVDYCEALGADRLVEVTDVQLGILSLKANEVEGMDFKTMEELFSWVYLASEKPVREYPRAGVCRCCSLAGRASKEYLEWIGCEDPEEYNALDRAHEFTEKLGVEELLTCAPNIVGQMPSKGEHTVTGESSVVVFQNSVLGARTNCEGLITSGCAALVGRIPNIGMHLDENRLGTHLVKVEEIPEELYEWDLLGYWIGANVHTGVPVLDIDIPYISLDAHKSMGAAVCTSGLVDMYHVIGLTPEAQTMKLAFGKNTPETVLHYGMEEKEETLRKLDYAKEDDVDFIILGCPHYSLNQLNELAALLDGRKCRSRLLILAAPMLIEQAEKSGTAQIIRESGAFLNGAYCPPGVALYPENMRIVATDSAKMAHYLPSKRPDVQIHMGSMEDCVR